MASVISFNHDGFEIARVRTKRRWMPAWHVIFFVYMIFVVRLITMIDIGPASYGNRVAELANGSAIERIAARVMRMDPVSHQFVIEARSGLRKLGLL